MEEPIADMVRGILDGHVVLDREIAERGRYPAIDVRRSVSRSLPAAASDTENQLLQRARAILGLYEENAPLIRAGLYSPGADPALDEAVQRWPMLDQFIGSLGSRDAEESYQILQAILMTVEEEEALKKAAAEAAPSSTVGEEQVGSGIGAETETAL